MDLGMKAWFALACLLFVACSSPARETRRTGSSGSQEHPSPASTAREAGATSADSPAPHVSGKSGCPAVEELRAPRRAADAAGCPCQGSLDLCIEGLALVCRDGAWRIVKDGPCGMIHQDQPSACQPDAPCACYGDERCYVNQGQVLLCRAGLWREASLGECSKARR
jgi:hypothetical protein